MKLVKPEDLKENPFDMIGKEWMLITAKRDGKVNTMTASWGGLGVMWNLDVAFAVIRESRYTKEFVDAADSFSLSFLDHDQYQKELGYLGSISGRVEDKINKCNFHVLEMEGVPYIEEANKVLICKKIFSQWMKPEGFAVPDMDHTFYGNKDYHEMYIGHITHVLVVNK